MASKRALKFYDYVTQYIDENDLLGEILTQMTDAELVQHLHNIITMHNIPPPSDDEDYWLSFLVDEDEEFEENPSSGKDHFTGVAWTAICGSDMINGLIDMAGHGVSTDEIAEKIENTFDEEYPFRYEHSVYSDLLDAAMQEIDYIKLARTVKSYVRKYGLKYF